MDFPCLEKKVGIMKKSIYLLRVHLLGRFQLWRDGELISSDTWHAEKSKSILKLLFSERGRVYTHEEFISDLFPDLDPDKAALDIRVRVCELRRILEPTLERREHSQFILTTHGGYYFNPDAHCWIDLEEFAEHCKKAFELERHGRWTHAIRNYEAADQLYQGDYLAEDRYEEWAIAPRERWREAYLIALSHLADCYAHLGHYEMAIGCCRRALCTAPDREDCYRQLMFYHYLEGNQTEALKAFEQCREHLQHSLAQEPSDITQKFYEQILHRSVSHQGNGILALPQMQFADYPVPRF